LGRPIYVVGHKNPDTDSIAAAIGYADLKRRTGTPEATPARLGDPNPETRYLLGRFGLPAPELLTDVYTRVRDVMNPEPQYLSESATMRDAGAAITDKRILPVVDGDSRLLGVVTLDDVAARYLRQLDLASGVQNRIAYASILHTLDGELLSGDREGVWQGRVWVGAMRAETMASLVQPGDMVVVGDRADAQLAAIERGVACVVLVGDAEPDGEALRLASQRGVRLIRTPHDSYRVTRLLNLSIPVSEVMRRDALTAEVDELASEAEESLSTRGTIALPVVDGDHKLVGILSRSDLLRSRGKGVILVDHNHSTQAVDGLEQAQLLEVIDHHNLGDLHTPEPILMKLEPVGSTSTILAEMYRDAGLKPDPPVAGMLAGGVVSDTLLFRSPTCTPRDRAAGEWLASIAEIDLEELAQGMFRANSNYDRTTPAQLVAGNLKLYEWGGKRVAIGQAETVDIEYFSRHQEALRSALNALKDGGAAEYAFFLATDILAQSSLLLLPGEEESALAQRAFGVTATDGCAELPGVVSRKKQVVPPLARELI
jgi:manganese-dependent inorganic pyrophosphatase